MGCPPKDTGAPALSLGAVAQLAYDALGDWGSAAIAAAIAVPESGLRPGRLNDCPASGDLSYGLWQINMIGNLGPARRAQFGIASNDELYDPKKNARAMAIISGGGGHWTDWTTWNNGLVDRATIDRARAEGPVYAEGHGGGDPGGFGVEIPGLPEVDVPTPEIPNPWKAVTSVADFLKLIGEHLAWLFDLHNLFRVLQFTAGAAAVIMGAIVLVKGVAPVQTLTGGGGGGGGLVQVAEMAAAA